MGYLASTGSPALQTVIAFEDGFPFLLVAAIRPC